MEVSQEQYEAAIPKCCSYRSIEEHKNIMLCWGLMAAVMENRTMDCNGCTEKMLQQSTDASRLQKPLNGEQRAILDQQLKRNDLQIFTAVRMAQKDLAKGDYDMALSRLRMDADKLRDEKELYAIIRYYFD